MIVCMMNDLDPRTDSAFIYQYLIFFSAYIIIYTYFLWIICVGFVYSMNFLRMYSTMTCDT